MVSHGIGCEGYVKDEVLKGEQIKKEKDKWIMYKGRILQS